MKRIFFLNNANCPNLICNMGIAEARKVLNEVDRRVTNPVITLQYERDEMAMSHFVCGVGPAGVWLAFVPSLFSLPSVSILAVLCR